MKKPLPIVICILYICFLCIDMWFPAYRRFSVCFKFMAVLLCLCLVLVQKRHPIGSEDQSVVQMAFTVTVISDFLLLFTPFHAVAVFIFCGTHLFYIARFQRSLLQISAIFYLTVTILAGIARLLHLHLPYELIAGGCYAVLILTACGCSFTAKLPRAQKRLAVAGMLLFVLCDIHVLLFNLFPMIGYHRAAGFLMWFFYLPAQLCLALSAGHREKGLRQTNAHRSQQPL